MSQSSTCHATFPGPKEKKDILVGLSLTRPPPRAVSSDLWHMGTSAHGRADGLEGLEEKLISKRFSVGRGRAAIRRRRTGLMEAESIPSTSTESLGPTAELYSQRR